MKQGSWLRQTFILWRVLVPFLLGEPAAVALNWQGLPFFLKTRGMPLVNLLQDLCANYGVPVRVSDEVKEIFVGSLKSCDPERVLDRLGQLYGLVWYEDGETLYVYKATEAAGAVVSVEFLKADTAIKYLKEMGAVEQKACRIKLVKGFNSFEVFGVPICLKRVQTLTEELDKNAERVARKEEVVQIFPLKYANAQDIEYEYRQQKVVIPGVLSLLRAMHTHENTSPVSREDPGSKEFKSLSEEGGSLPQFTTDPRQNAIVIRDRKVQMPVYQNLIKQLDKKSQQIEISVSIVDVLAEALNTLGADLSARFGRGKLGVSINQTKNFKTGDGMVASVLGNGYKFKMKLHALKNQSKAKILSEPSVVTLDNVQAVLDKNTTFYTQFKGKNESHLEAITAGTLMRVTPRLIEGPTGKEIFLQLNLQDGVMNEMGQKSDQLPQVKNSEISTQARLKVGEALLLGGFVQDRMTTEMQGLPLLGDLPIVGRLFSLRKNATQRLVRLFLIEARPISL